MIFSNEIMLPPTIPIGFSFYEYIKYYDMNTIVNNQKYIDIPFDFIISNIKYKWDWYYIYNNMDYATFITYYQQFIRFDLESNLQSVNREKVKAMLYNHRIPYEYKTHYINKTDVSNPDSYSYATDYDLLRMDPVTSTFQYRWNFKYVSAECLLDYYNNRIGGRMKDLKDFLLQTMWSSLADQLSATMCFKELLKLIQDGSLRIENLNWDSISENEDLTISDITAHPELPFNMSKFNNRNSNSNENNHKTYCIEVAMMLFKFGEYNQSYNNQIQCIKKYKSIYSNIIKEFQFCGT